MNKPTIPRANLFSCPIGIDFGTTNSAMSRYANTLLVKGPESFNFPLTGSTLYPSMAYLDAELGVIKTGVAAYNKRFLEPEKVISSIKRHITDNANFVVKGQSYSSVDIAKSIISDFIREIYLTDHDLHPKCVVVTVPYYFGENENTLIKLAAEQAIKECIQCDTNIFLIPEQVAASIASIYNLNMIDIDSKLFFIYDIGGGTLDVTLVRITSNASRFNYEVLANDGIARFGGDDIDTLLYNYVLKNVDIDSSSLTPYQLLVNRARLLNECKEAKHHLSFSTSYTLLCTNLFGVESGCIEIVITQDILNGLLSGLLGSDRNMLLELHHCIDSIYAKAKINPESVNYTIPIGGTSFIPLFRSYVKSVHKCSQEIASGNLMDNLTMVANGASIYAAMKSDEICNTHYHPFACHNAIEMIKTRVSHSLYVEKYNGKFDLIIPANSISPIQVKKRYYPAKFKDKGGIVDLAEVRLFQGKGESRKLGSYIGMIDFSQYIIYTHDRNINEIPIEVTIEATDTLVKAHCRIPKSDIQGNDIVFTQIIHD